eukprot:14020555-Ditylum_brightwellii.AAC.1
MKKEKESAKNHNIVYDTVFVPPSKEPCIGKQQHKTGATWDFDEVTIFTQLAFGGEWSNKQYISTKVQRHLRTTNNEVSLRHRANIYKSCRAVTKS